jgi:hypothetical protein
MPLHVTTSQTKATINIISVSTIFTGIAAAFAPSTL